MFRALSGDGLEIHLQCEGVGNDEIYLITYGRKLQANRCPYDTGRLVLAKGKVESITFQPYPSSLSSRTGKNHDSMIYHGEAVVHGFDLFQKDANSPFGYVTSGSVTKDRVDQLLKADEEGMFQFGLKFSRKTAFFNREIAEIRLAELQHIRDTCSYADFADATDGAIVYVI